MEKLSVVRTNEEQVREINEKELQETFLGKIYRENLLQDLCVIIFIRK